VVVVGACARAVLEATAVPRMPSEVSARNCLRDLDVKVMQEILAAMVQTSCQGFTWEIL
jgi:hypothetical protein